MGQWSGIGVKAGHRTGKQLAPVLHAAVNVSANVVGVILLKIMRGHRVPRQDAVAETGRETFDLLFYGSRHIDIRSMRNVAVRPAGMLPRGRSGVHQISFVG